MNSASKESAIRVDILVIGGGTAGSVAFLEKSGAEKWAQANNGNLLTYAEARKFVGGERLAQAR
jgi:hypothetical protein